MKRIHYLNCPECGKEYFIEKRLYLEQERNSEIKLICPYCHKEFYGKDAKFVD